MIKRLFLLLFLLTLSQYHSTAHAQTSLFNSEEISTESPAEIRTIVPEGVREIDLRKPLGDAASFVVDSWMLNADVCVILQQHPEGEDYDLILLDTRDCSVLSQTPVPHAVSLFEQGRDDGAFYLLFTIEGTDIYDSAISYVKATVSSNGTVEIGTAPSRLTVMPGGKTAVLEAADGSLYAVDLSTGEEELLLQGVPDAMTSDRDEASYETFSKYVPSWDDIGHDGKDAYGYPLSMTFPIGEDDYYNNDIWFWRDFFVYKPLDEYRFVYTVSGWEWGAGYGIYDLQTRTDHRITGRGFFYGMAGNTLYGSTLMADANTYESSPLPNTIQAQLEEVSAMEDGAVNCAISPNGRLLALIGMKFRSSNANTVTITDIQTGNIIKTYDIYNPHASESSVSFYSNTQFMLFFQPKENDSAYMYLFNVED